MALLAVPAVLLGQADLAGATPPEAHQPPAAPPPASLVFQALGCGSWAEVPGNFTPESPLDDTNGSYRGWGPIDVAVVEPVDPGDPGGTCHSVDGVRFRVSARPWGTDLAPAASDPNKAANDPPAPTPDATTSTVSGATGADGEGQLVADSTELSSPQQTSLFNGSGLWVAATGFEGDFANLRCHQDRYNADNLEVIRATATDSSMVCVLYVIQAARVPSPSPPTTPGPSPSPLPVPSPAAELVVAIVPGSGQEPDQDAAAPESAAPAPGGNADTGGGLSSAGPERPAMMAGSRAVQEGLADLDSRLVNPGAPLDFDQPSDRALGNIAKVAEPITAIPAGPTRLLGPRLAGSRITVELAAQPVAPLQAPVTQNLTVALAAGLCALFVTGLGLTIRVAGRPF